MSGSIRQIVRAAARLLLIGLSLAAFSPARAQQDAAVLFQNVRIFDGKSGVLSAPSNVLVRNNNPLDNIRLVADPDKNFLVIMKGGKVYKNLLAGDKRK